jgi:hypothetical protein
VIKTRRALQSLLAVNCHEQIVTTSDFADISIQSCLMGVPQLADWMQQHPAERLAAWRCVIGTGCQGSLRRNQIVSQFTNSERANI